MDRYGIVDNEGRKRNNV